MSHPTQLNLEKEPFSTGYTTTNEIDIITKIIFVDSPDVRNGRIKEYASYKHAFSIMDVSRGFPENTEIMQNVNKKYQFFLNGELFYRIFMIELTTNDLLKLTYELSDYLSHPLKPEWDGKTFEISKIAV